MVKYGLIAMIYVLLQGALGANLSLFVTREGLGTTATTGLLGSLGMAGGIMGGMMFGRLSKYADKWIYVITFIGMALGFVLLCFAKSLALCMIAVIVLGVRQGLHMPSCLFALTEELQPGQMVLGSSVICAIAPNLAGILSPLIITNVSTALWGEMIRPRFFLVACLSFVIGLGFVISACRNKVI